MTDLSHFFDLAAQRLGGQVLFANDEFFAPKENLLKAAEPVWKPARYTDRGKWMDGWESRRKRGPGHDWCLIRLGLPGRLRHLVIDTAHFKGNYPEACSVEGCSIDGDPPAVAEGAEPPHELAGDAVAPEWIEVLPRSPLQGDHRHVFEVSCPWRFTHLRLSIYPDGGVARLRALGEVLPEPLPAGAELDLLAVAHGARTLASSDAFFCPPSNLQLPGPPLHMGDGWETRRRRGPGHDWAVFALPGAAEVERVEVDTARFKGNAPARCELQGMVAAQGPDAAPPPLLADGAPWQPILPTMALRPDHRHLFREELESRGPATHLRFAIEPDGGVARLRLWGRYGAEGASDVGLRWLNSLPPATARDALLACCGSARWAQAMGSARPFPNVGALEASAGRIWTSLEQEDSLEAFAAHPRIGETQGTSAWSRGEQAGAAAASADTRERLVLRNRAYEERFGHVFLVCATGKSAEEMLALLEARIDNSPDHELAIAAAEQAKITRLRLAKLLVPPEEPEKGAPPP